MSLKSNMTHQPTHQISEMIQIYYFTVQVGTGQPLQLILLKALGFKMYIILVDLVNGSTMVEKFNQYNNFKYI